MREMIFFFIIGGNDFNEREEKYSFSYLINKEVRKFKKLIYFYISIILDFKTKKKYFNKYT